MAPKILRVLVRLVSAPASIGDLAEPFAMSLPAVSKHVRVLERAGLVRRSIDGRVHRCSFEAAPLAAADDWIGRHRLLWEDALGSLANYVAKRTTMKPSLQLVVRRTIPARPERLFAAWTEPEQLRAWWGPRGVRCTGAEVDARVGGRHRLLNELPDGRTLVISGTFVTLEPPERLVYTWAIDRSGEEPENELVTVQFQAHPLGTEVIVTHERIADARARDEHAAGWEGCLEGLANHV